MEYEHDIEGRTETVRDKMLGNFGIGANHNKLHTNAYFTKVNLLIEKAFYMDGDERKNV